MSFKIFLFFCCFSTNVIGYSDTFNNTFQLSSPLFFGFQSKINNLYWIATGNGISSFDGQRFENYEVENPFYGLGCFKLIEDKYGRVWFYTGNGNIVFYNGYEFKQISYSEDIHKALSNAVIADFTYFKDEISILIHHNIILDSFQVINIKFTDLRTYEIKRVVLKFARKHAYWVAELNNMPIIIMDSTRSEKFYKVSGKDNVFFSGRRIMNYKYDNFEFIFDYKKSEINNVKFENGKYLISTFSGCIIYDCHVKKELSKYSYRNVSYSFYDNDNNIILTTLNYKLIIVPKYSVKEILNNSRDIIKIKTDNNSLLIVDIEYNLWSYEWKKNKKKLIVDNYKKNFADKNIFLNNNNIYFNQIRINRYRNKFLKEKIGFVPFQCYKIANSSNFISTGYADVKVVDSIGVKKRTIFYGKRVYDAKMDSKGVLWVATISGLYIGKVNFQKNWEVIFFDTLFKDKIVEQIQFYNNLTFVLVNRKSINIIGAKIQYDVFDSSIIKNKIINKYLIINSRSIILCTNIGLCYVGFRLNNNIFQVSRSVLMGGFKGANAEDGISDFDTLNGKVYFVAKNKLFSVDLIHWESVKSSYKCCFTSVYTGRRFFDIIDLQNGAKLKLETDETSIDISIVNSYYNKSSIDELYRYYIIYNNDTSSFKYSSTDILKFYNLRFGNYKLIIQGRNDMSQWGEFNKLEFYIKPKFIETKIFSGLIVLSVIIIISMFSYLFFTNKQKRIANKNLVLESENYQLQLLKSQLNPHFLFNSLNSLKGLVYLEKKDVALEYTDRLSVFLRNVLSSGKELEGLLSNEILLINNYIEVERLRLNDRLEWKVDCKEILKTLYIPTNILQPIVENSVKYGYSPLNEKLTIKLECIRYGSELWIIIDDNGKGIRYTEGKTSFSSEAIKKRVDKFNKGKIKDNFSLFELRHEGQIIGVRAIIKIIVNEDIDS